MLFPPNEDTLARRVIEALERHPTDRSVRLVGSRAEGGATAFSDYDFEVDTERFDVVARAMPSLVEPLHPIAQQWDRLSEHQCYMLMLPGPVKVDLIFEEPHEDEPPWQPDAGNLNDIDRHFWDWILWLRSKSAKGDGQLVSIELRKLFDHLLQPIGVPAVPESIGDAIDSYMDARARTERDLGVAVSRALERVVQPKVT